MILLITFQSTNIHYVITYEIKKHDFCFIISWNIANYLQILKVEHMYLPVPVNFIFIGFEWSGNQGI